MEGNKRVDETVAFFNSLLPKRSNQFEKLYSKAWNPADYPVVLEDSQPVVEEEKKDQ